MVFFNRLVRWSTTVAATVLIATSSIALAQAQTVQHQVEVAAIPVGVIRVQTVEGITEYRLANGLKVLLAPDLSDDRVSVNLTYLVGSRHEGYGETGMAHLLEHLMFKGSPGTADPKAEFRKRGFTFNGTTNSDRTNYFATFVSSQESLDWYLGWQADAMVNSFIAKKDLDSEMTVVRSEFEIAGNNPFAALSQRVMAAAYPWHNYGKPTIGNQSDIENVDITHLQAFYQRYYRPDNAVLIVAGKFDLASTMAGIQRSLGQLKKPGIPVPQTYTLEPAQDGERSVVVRRPAPSQFIHASYHGPAALHPDQIPLAVLTTALSDAPSGRLHKTLVESKLAQAAFAGVNRQREASSIVFGTVFGPDDDPAQRQSLLLGITENMLKEPLRQDEFDRARTRLEKNVELAFANAGAVANAAAHFEVMGDWRAVFVDRERLKAVTLDDVNRVAHTYLLASNRTLGHLIPTQSPVRAPQIAMPDVAAYLQGFALSENGMESTAFDFSTPSLHEKVVFAATPDGIKAAALPKPVRGDLVQVNIAFKFGNRQSLMSQGPAAMMANAMLLRGTPKMTRQQIQDELIRLGVALNMSFGDEGGGVSLTAKKVNFKPALELALHLLKESNFPSVEFEEVRSAWVKNIEGQMKDKSARANNAWSRYGNSYLRGDPRYTPTLEESLEEVKSVTRDQAYAFYRRFYGAQNAQVSLLGPVDVHEYQQLLSTALDGWHAPELWRRVERPLIDVAPARLVFDTPDKTNVSLRAKQGVPVCAHGMDSDYFAMELATRIFGGGPGSRLWVRLREAGGLSYSAGAGFGASPYERSGSISMSAEVAPQNVSIADKALQDELARTVGEGFTATEVETFKRQTLADRLRSRSGDGWAMSFMSGQLEFAYPKDEREKNDALIQSFTPEHINTVWRKYVHPEKWVWGIFGDQSKIK